MSNAVHAQSRFSLGRALVYLVLLLGAAYFLMPLLVMIGTSLKTQQEIREGTLLSLPQAPTAEAWVKAWSQACIGVSCEGLKPHFWNSLRMAIPAVAISTLLGALNGYVLSLWRFRGAGIVFGMIVLGCFIPFQVVILPMARLLGEMGLAGTVSGLVLVHVIYGLAFTTLFFRNFYISVPQDLIRAATIDGAGFFKIFWRVLLPISPPIIIVTVIWQFTGIWNDFLFGAVFSAPDSQPITVALNNMVQTSTGVKEYNVDMAATLITGLPTLIVYVLSGKYFVRGLTAGSLKG